MPNNSRSELKIAGAASGTRTLRMICSREAPSVRAVSTYRSGTSITAAAVSLTTKATLAMNRNITFWNSPIPKKKNVSGISAATGMLRPKIVSGATNARTAGKQAAQTPSGTPTSPASPKPRSTRRSVTSVLATSRRSPNTPGTALSVSPGLGSVAGLMNLVSASPAVAANHAATTAATQVSPQRKAVPTPVSPRSGRADCGADDSDVGVIPAPRRRP